MNWHYTDGHLTLRVEGEEHKFSLEELISSSYVYKDIIKKVQKIFLFLLFMIATPQLIGQIVLLGGIPADQSAYFYIGFFGFPLFLAGFVAFLFYLYFRYSKKEIIKLDSMLKEYLKS